MPCSVRAASVFFLALQLVWSQHHSVDEEEEGQLGLLGWGTNQAEGRYAYSKVESPQYVLMTANPTVIASGDSVILRWSDAGSYKPRSNDWFGWYCGRDVTEVGDRNYLSWAYVSVDSNWDRNRSGTSTVMLFTFANTQCEFRMFNHDGGTAYYKIGTSNLIQVIGDGPRKAEVAMFASPATLRYGDVVELSWENFKGYQSRSNDWIGFYCGNLTQVVDTGYLDYRWVTVDSGYSSGFGRERIAVQSGRQRYCEFRMFKYVQGSPYYRIGTSNAIEVTDVDSLVQHLHLALTGDSTEMRVQWAASTSRGVVQFAPASAAWHSSAVRNVTGLCHSYQASDMCHAPATHVENFVDPGHLCEAVMTGLTPDAQYKYRISTDGNSFSSAPVFRAAPEVNPEYRFKYIVYGDMGTWSTANGPIVTAKLAAKEMETGARMTHHFGDLGYARGYANVWDVWMHMIEPYAKVAPYMVGIGNHEFDYKSGEHNDPSGDAHFQPPWGNMGGDSGGECAVPTSQRFHMPSERSGGNAVFWHSYDFGSLHTIMLSSEHSCGDGSAQKNWLAADLAKVDRARTPWVVVEIHRPMYNNERYWGDFKVAAGLQRQFEDLLVQYDVDLVLAGHYHSYIRSKRIYKDRADEQRGIYHFTIGSAGASLDNVGLYKRDWVEVYDRDFGFGRITIENSTVMHWEYIRNKENAEMPVTVDEVWIVKKHSQNDGTLLYF